MSGRRHSHIVTPIPFSPDPVTVRIGVTGHRTLKDPEKIRRSIRDVLTDLDHRLLHARYRYHVVSPLAEGADRLVAKCVLDWTGRSASLFSPQLEIILPMPPDEYFATFGEDHRAESIAEFNSFEKYIPRQRVLPRAGSREEAYERVGQEVVQNCDILIAIWDGSNARGKGGTAEIVNYAESTKNCTIFIIDAITAKIRTVTSNNDAVSQVEFLRIYNQESLHGTPIHEEIEKELEKLKRKAKEAGLDPAMLDPLKDGIFTHFRKAARLASQYQTWYVRSTVLAYVFSAAAVATAAIGALLFDNRWPFFVGEAVLIILVIGLVWFPRSRSWQRKWIDYRYLAERLRASTFLYVAGLREETSEPPADLQLSWLPDSWVVLAIRQLWSGHDPEERKIEDAKISSFLFTAWIDQQQQFYASKSQLNERKNERLELALNGFLGATLAAAIIHFAGPYFIAELECTSFPNFLSVIAVTLPAVASALAGISVFLHYNRTAERYESMSRYLEKIGKAMTGEIVPPTVSAIPSLSPLQQLVREADRSMAHEHQGWRTVFGVHLPGPG